MGLQFHVEPGVLIPRPETEVLVTETLGLKSEFDQNSVTIWDIGTGSGCIAVSLAYHWPSCHVIASDISEKALSICERNSRLNHVEDRVQLIRHDILNNSLPANIQADIVVSNPPYVSHEELKTLDAEIVGYEPHVALTDFADGMLFYKTLLQINFNDLKCSHVLIEMSGSQTEKIKELVYDLKFKEVSLINDLNKIPRILKIRIK